MDEETLPSIKATIRKHGTSLGINFKSNFVKQFNLQEGDEIIVIIKRPKYGDTPLQDDFLRWMQDKRKKEILKSYQERYKRNKKLFERWYEERVKKVLFHPIVEGEYDIELPSEEDFEQPKYYHVKLQKNHQIRIPREVAIQLEKLNAGKIIKDSPSPEKWFDDFMDWLNEQKAFEQFIKAHPELEDKYQKLVRQGKLIRKEEFYWEEFNKWKNITLDLD